MVNKNKKYSNELYLDEESYLGGDMGGYLSEEGSRLLKDRGFGVDEINSIRLGDEDNADPISMDNFNNASLDSKEERDEKDDEPSRSEPSRSEPSRSEPSRSGPRRLPEDVLYDREAEEAKRHNLTNLLNRERQALNTEKKNTENLRREQNAERKVLEAERNAERRMRELSDVRNTRTTYVYDPIVYRRLYEWGLGLFPSYHEYSKRKLLEESLHDLIKRELKNHQSESILEEKIRGLIQNEPQSKTVPSKPKRASSKKATKSKRASSKKTTKPKRASSKKSKQKK